MVHELALNEERVESDIALGVPAILKGTRPNKMRNA